MSIYAQRFFLICISSLTVSWGAFAQVQKPEPTLPGPTTHSPTTMGDPNSFSPQALEAIKAKALVVNISAKIVNGKETVWSANQRRVTVHGLSVSVRLESANLLILAEITPYRLGETVMLVVKSELWSRNVGDSSVQYFASLKSATLNWDEPIYFYPLGARATDDQPRISMEISVNRYQDSKN